MSDDCCCVSITHPSENFPFTVRIEAFLDTPPLKSDAELKLEAAVKAVEAAAAEANARKDEMAQEVASMKRLLEARNREQEVADAKIADMR